MPKKKNQRKSREVVAEQSKTIKPWVRWSAIVVILALLFSAMLAAMSTTPASAASASPSICAPIDTDGDGIYNNNDPDVDGDGIVDGEDGDIDGDGIENAKDNDPASTNCELSTTPPIMMPPSGSASASAGIAWQWVIGILAIGFGYLTLRQVRRRK